MATSSDAPRSSVRLSHASTLRPSHPAVIGIGIQMANDWRKLRVGDRVRLLRVPEADLRQREDEVSRGAEMGGSTADALERIIAIGPVVTIHRVDAYGAPWFNYELAGASGQTEYHSFTITENDSWELVGA